MTAEDVLKQLDRLQGQHVPQHAQHGHHGGAPLAAGTGAHHAPPPKRGGLMGKLFK